MIFVLREHPFNLKGGGGGAMVFFGVTFFFRFAAQQKFCRDIIFFLQNQYFLRHKVLLTEYFFLPISETEMFFNEICRQKCFPPKKP